MRFVYAFGAFAFSAIAAAFVVPLTVQPVAATMAGTSCAGGIVDVLIRSASAMPYRMHTTIVEGPAITEVVTEVVPYHAMRVVKTAEGAVTEMVFFHDRGWINRGSGWAAVGWDIAHSMLGSVRPSNIFLAAGEPQQARCHGLTMVDGMAYLGFSYVYVQEDREVQNHLLVDPVTGLSARAETRVLTGGVLTSTSTVDYSYDQAIVVLPPRGTPLL